MERGWLLLGVAYVMVKIICYGGNAVGMYQAPNAAGMMIQARNADRMTEEASYKEVLRDYRSETGPKPELQDCPAKFEGKMYSELLPYNEKVERLSVFRMDRPTSEAVRKAAAGAILQAVNQIQICYGKSRREGGKVMWYEKEQEWYGESEVVGDFQVLAFPKLARGDEWERGFEARCVSFNIYEFVVKTEPRIQVGVYEKALVEDVNVWRFEVAWKYMNLHVIFLQYIKLQPPIPHNTPSHPTLRTTSSLRQQQQEQQQEQEQSQSSHTPSWTPWGHSILHRPPPKSVFLPNSHLTRAIAPPQLNSKYYNKPPTSITPPPTTP